MTQEFETGNWKNELNEIDDTDKSLSIIVYGENQTFAYDAASKLFGKRIAEGKDVWKKTVQGKTIFGYTRWYEAEGDMPKPKSPVYGFYFHMLLSAEDDYQRSKEIEEFCCNTFLLGSVGIPDDCKLLHKQIEPKYSNSEFEYTNDFRFYTKKDITLGSEKIFENIIANHNNMKKIFDEIDTDKSGALDAKEVMTLLNLNENSDKEMAEEYLSQISDKEVNFDRFRKWFIQRQDYNDITYTVSQKVNGLATAEKFSKIFKVCEEDIQKMTPEEKGREFNSTFGINPSKEIIRGIDLELNVQAGDKIQALCNSVHDFAKDEQILFTLRIGAKSEDAGKTLKSTLEMLKGMAFGAISELKEKLNVKFVLQKSSVYIYVMVKNDPSLEKIKRIFSSYDLSNLHLNSRFNFQFRTRLSPADLLTEDFETLIEKFAQIKLSVMSKIKFSIIAKFLSKLSDNIFEGEYDKGNKRDLKFLIPIINFFRIMPKVTSNIEYHEEDAIAYLKDLGEIFPEELEFEKLKGMVEGNYLPMLKEQFEGAKGMFKEQAEGFKEAIEAIDFTEIHLSLMVKSLSLMVETNIDIRNMDTIIDKFFN